MTQDQALDILKMGHNVFLTGPAGCGKTFLLNSYIDYLKAHVVPVAVTASTGIAATHMDGVTIHSWSGIGIREQLSELDLKNLFYNILTRERLNGVRVLIIDEISMLADFHIDMVDLVCRRLRQNPAPFGGLQVIFCGDFFQLPPVQTSGNPAPNFACAASAWEMAGVKVCYLEKQYRQNDERFLEVLNAVRASEVTDKTLAILMERHQKTVEGFLKPTKLYTHNGDVDAINAFELAQIDAPGAVYTMEERGELNLVAKLKKNCLAPQELVVKIGAVVMFVKNNFSRGYVNGTIGTVVGFDTENNYPIVKVMNGAEIVAIPASWKFEEDGNPEAEIIQIPLRLAWAITVHKSQGMSLDCAEIDLSKAFIEGMGYVALSRVRTLHGIKLMGINKKALQVNPSVTELDKKLKELSQINEKELRALKPNKKQKIQQDFVL